MNRLVVFIYKFYKKFIQPPGEPRENHLVERSSTKKMTGRVDIPWRIFEKSAKLAIHEITGTEKYSFLVNYSKKNVKIFFFVL